MWYPDDTNRMRRPLITVIGDAMLDRYTWGTVSSISPEAAIPIVRHDKSEDRPGGAAGVAAMIAALEARVSLITTIGADAAGDNLIDALQRLGVSIANVIQSSSRQTIVKERVFGASPGRHSQQLLRIDRECQQPLTDGERDAIACRTADNIQSGDIVVISDYDKGTCDARLCRWVISHAKSLDVSVLVDPSRQGEVNAYLGCECIKPNRHEARLISQMETETVEQVKLAASKINAIGFQHVLITMDRDGLVWAKDGHSPVLIPAEARNVFDVTGAGDMVISALAVALASGASYPDAITFANECAGMQVERIGAVPVPRHELVSRIKSNKPHHSSKGASLMEAAAISAACKTKGQTVVLTNGCFDLLHPGHLASLQYARRLGDFLIVAVNDDKSVCALKGQPRPIVPIQHRQAMLEALECVDCVVAFSGTSVRPVVEAICPNVLVKSGEYDIDGVVGSDLVVANGGKIELSPRLPGYSTSEMVKRISEAMP
jgi:D-beta-D-heptose 7-phosphate kinase/D-beta-D-heptose 1-phosphate adenosyltransferase